MKNDRKNKKSSKERERERKVIEILKSVFTDEFNKQINNIIYENKKC